MPLFTAKCDDSVRIVGKPETIQKRVWGRLLPASRLVFINQICSDNPTF